MRMRSRFGLAGLVGLIAVLLNSCTATHGPATTGASTGFMWVASQGDQLVTFFNINLSSGVASEVGTGAPTGLGPVAIAFAPSAGALFVANRDDNTISYYALNSDGSLPTPCPPPKAANCNTIAAGPVAGTPVALAVDPSGKFLFVANQASQLVYSPPNTPDTVAVFTIGSGGALTAAGFFASTGNGPAALAAPPAGNFLYVANQFTSTVSILSYSSTGVLTEDPTSPVSLCTNCTNPTGLAFSRCAGATAVTTNCATVAPPAYLYVANNGSNNISIYSACIQATTACPAANGTLSQTSGSPVGAGPHPVSFLVNPARNQLYAVDNSVNQVSEYQYSPATGLLTPLSPATASTGSSPLSGGITTDGNWAFVPNNGASNVSAYTIGPAGQLATGTQINLVGQPSAVLIQ
jgi:6-phosphogluconolactonase (cycloisomerase 2 family)